LLAREYRTGHGNHRQYAIHWDSLEWPERYFDVIVQKQLLSHGYSIHLGRSCRCPQFGEVFIEKPTPRKPRICGLPGRTSYVDTGCLTQISRCVAALIQPTNLYSG
jgi:hypothetical protein